MLDVKMVDVGNKPNVERIAVASGEIRLKVDTLQKIRENSLEKGDAITTSKIAAITAAKNTARILPLCHPLSLSNVTVDIRIVENKVIVTTKVKAIERTGVEMEALTATTVALLNIWDMTKMYEKDGDGQYPSTVIQNVKVEKKIKKINEIKNDRL
ncbi:MAG: cyclic pyranopterin monophosphate synthase MoaC [Promethearchaeota archaeon]